MNFFFKILSSSGTFGIITCFRYSCQNYIKYIKILRNRFGYKTSQKESTRSSEYTPLYGKGIKEQQIKSMETTEITNYVYGRQILYFIPRGFEHGTS